MSIEQQIIQTAITSFTTLIGHGNLFARVKAEVERTNAAIPDANGVEKKKKVLADLKIIFEDVLEPVGLSILHLLIELAVHYVKVAATAAIL